MSSLAAPVRRRRPTQLGCRCAKAPRVTPEHVCTPAIHRLDLLERSPLCCPIYDRKDC